MKFKLNFPTGYHFESVLNDNIDIYVILENGEVYYFTLFTLDNIQTIMNKDTGLSSMYFWATDMLIVRNLNIETIKSSIKDLVDKGYFGNIFKSIGNIESIFGNPPIYSELVE